jgi:hypothetical protein
LEIPLKLEGVFPSEQALREMVARRKVCFDHDPFYVLDGKENRIQIGFQLNLYGAFRDPRHLPGGDDPEYREIVKDLNNLCRVFFQSLEILKPCEYTEAPVHRIIYSPERRKRAEVCLQVPIFDREHFGVKSGRRLKELLATAECLLKSIGARFGKWDEDREPPAVSSETCAVHAREAVEGEDTEE